MTGPKRRAIAWGATRSLVFRVAEAFVGFGIVLVTARGFGAEGRGAYALTSLLASILVTPLGGVSTALAAEYAHRRSGRGTLYAAQLLFVLPGAVVAAGLLMIWMVADGAGGREFLYAAMASPFLLLTVYQVQLFQSEGDVRAMHWMLLAMAVVSLIALGGSAIVWPGDIWTALGVWTAAQAICPAAALFVQRRRANFSFRNAQLIVGRLLRRSFGVSLANGVMRMAYRVDLLVVALLLPLSQTGRYSIAIALAETPLLLSRAVRTGSFIAMVDVSSAALDITLRTLRHALLLLVAASIMVVLLTPLLIEPLLGGQFAGIWRPLALLVPGIVALGVAEVLRNWFLVRLERNREYLAMAFGGAAVNLVLAFALVPPFGIEGAALSTTAAYGLACAWYLARFVSASGERRVAAYLPGRRELADYVGLVRAMVAAAQRRMALRCTTEADAQASTLDSGIRHAAAPAEGSREVAGLRRREGRD